MKKVYSLFFILSLFVSCNTFPKIEQIEIKNHSEEIKFENKNGKYVNGLYCKITGEIEGNVEIEFMVGDGTSGKIIPENGKINFFYNADWYSGDFVIKIIPQDNAKGNIKIIVTIQAFFL
jgi:hypothetical protein